MTESEQLATTTADGFPIDASTKYKVDAGQCGQCGYYKTWGFKVQNTKSGKMMPGHVTTEGFKIGTGDCPKWAKIADLNKKKAEKKATAGTPQPPGTWIQEINHPLAASAANSAAIAGAATAAGPAGRPTGSLERVAQQAGSASETGHVVAFSVNGITITTTVADAIGAMEQIAASLRKILGPGA
jgi:hypothetical protein